jgi:hypothetical protein
MYYNVVSVEPAVSTSSNKNIVFGEYSGWRRQLYGMRQWRSFIVLTRNRICICIYNINDTDDIFTEGFCKYKYDGNIIKYKNYVPTRSTIIVISPLTYIPAPDSAPLIYSTEERIVDDY